MRVERSWLFGVLIATALVGCKDKDRDLRAASERVGEPVQRVDDIKASPLAYVGRDVTVIGEVDKVLDERAFEIEGDGVIWPKKLLVLSRAPVRFGPTKLEPGVELVVGGTVRRMAPDEVERELGQSIDRELALRYRGQAILVADSVRLIETQARWAKPYQQGAIVSAIRLVSSIDPETFAGHAVDLSNVPVRATSATGVWIGFGPRSELFIVPLQETQLVGIEAGDRVAIRGEVRALVPAGEAAKQPALEPARARGEKIYVEAVELTKLTPRPAT
jgi:hypothetical protein